MKPSGSATLDSLAFSRYFEIGIERACAFSKMLAMTETTRTPNPLETLVISQLGVIRQQEMTIQRRMGIASSKEAVQLLAVDVMELQSRMERFSRLVDAIC